METLLQYFIDYQYLVIFLGTFIEGEVVLIAGGFLVYEGYLNFTVLVLIVTLAAIIGDNFFYWLGHSQRVGTKHFWAAQFLNFVGEHRFFKGEKFLRRHGGKSVFVVRFFYGLRFAGAMTAGYLRMGFARFFPFNLFGSFRHDRISFWRENSICCQGGKASRNRSLVSDCRPFWYMLREW